LTSALLTKTCKTVPAARLTDVALTSNLRRFLSSILYSLNPAGVTPPIDAPDSEACMRVSLSTSALTILPFRTNGSKTHKAIKAKTPPALNKLRFVFVFFIF